MKALLLIDIQNGFCPGGNLAVPEGDQVVPVANRLIDSGRYDLVVASQDWHPRRSWQLCFVPPRQTAFRQSGTLSGKPQMMWPDHCVRTPPMPTSIRRSTSRRRLHPAEGPEPCRRQLLRLSRQRPGGADGPCRISARARRDGARSLRSGDRLLREILRARCGRNAARRRGAVRRGRQPRHRSRRRSRRNRGNAPARRRHHPQR